MIAVRPGVRLVSPAGQMCLLQFIILSCFLTPAWGCKGLSPPAPPAGPARAPHTRRKLALCASPFPFLTGHPIARLPFRAEQAAVYMVRPTRGAFTSLPLSGMEATRANARRLIKMAYAQQLPAHRTRTWTAPGPFYDLVVVALLVVLGVGLLF